VQEHFKLGNVTLTGTQAKLLSNSTIVKSLQQNDTESIKKIILQEAGRQNLNISGEEIKKMQLDLPQAIRKEVKVEQKVKDFNVEPEHITLDIGP